MDFATEIEPIFRRKCVKCHGPEKAKGRFRLDTRALAMKGGSEGLAIIAGNSEDSPLIHLVEDQDMPPEEDGAPLSAREIAKLKSWIDEGAKWGGSKKAPAPSPAPSGGGESSGGVSEVVEQLSRNKESARILPPVVQGRVDFSRDIEPLIQRHCIKCHGTEKPKGRFRLDNRVSALRGGAEGVSIVPGNSEGSSLIHYIAGLEEGMEMPPVGEGVALNDEEVGLFRAWIDQGANWGEAGESPGLRLTLTPGMQWWGVSGNKDKFREHNWVQDGWLGGADFTMEQWIDLNTRVTAEGRLFGPDHIDVTLSMERQDLGFVRVGAEHYRSYDNSLGGYYEGFDGLQQSIFDLDRELELDTGRVWMEMGLRRPDLPEMTLGYEYRFKEGTRSTLHWGASTHGLETTRNIYPAFTYVDEEIHTVRFDLKDTWRGYEWENNFEAEYSTLKSHGFDAPKQSTTTEPESFNTVDSKHEATRLTNSFSLQKRLSEKWLLTGGYYYSDLDADAAFQRHTIDGLGNLTVGSHWSSQPVVLDANTHMFNASSQFGPWDGLTVVTGVQGELHRQNALGDASLFFGLPNPNVAVPAFFQSTVSSSKKRATTTEFVSARYDRIPRTVLFAEGQWEQGTTDYFEQDTGILQGFLRDTEHRERDMDLRGGMILSPMSRMSIHAQFRYRDNEDRYDHLRTEGRGGVQNVGYSGFILGRDSEMEEFRLRLNVQPKSWLRTLFTYESQSTKYHTETDEVTLGFATDTPGGWLLAGDHDQDVCSLDVTLTPWERLSLNGGVSYHSSRTQTESNDDAGLVDFEGDYYSLLLSGSFRVSDRTNFTAGCSYQRGDFSQNNVAEGLPLGIEYEQYALQAGVSSQVRDDLSVNLQYIYQSYDEPTGGGYNDYTAHGVFAGCSLRW